MKAKTLAFTVAIFLTALEQALAWGSKGHKAIALVAQPCLTPAVRNEVAAMLGADPDNLTPHDIASKSTWADKYRDSNHRKDHYEQTKNWHFVDMEIRNPDLKSACFGRPPLPSGTLASNGPRNACVVDKIEQFETELAAPGTDADERALCTQIPSPPHR